MLFDSSLHQSVWPNGQDDGVKNSATSGGTQVLICALKQQQNTQCPPYLKSWGFGFYFKSVLPFKKQHEKKRKSGEKLCATLSAFFHMVCIFLKILNSSCWSMGKWANRICMWCVHREEINHFPPDCDPDKITPS